MTDGEHERPTINTRFKRISRTQSERHYRADKNEEDVTASEGEVPRNNCASVNVKPPNGAFEESN